MIPISISSEDRCLVIAPHPDDEAIGCGGLILKYGSQFDIAVLTDGCLGNPEWSEDKTSNIRQKEFAAAMNFAGINNCWMLGIRDGDLKNCFEQFAQLDIEAYNYIFIPHPQEDHSDHRVVFDFLKRIVKKTKTKIMGYEVWSALTKPTHYLDISELADKKKKLISYYKSQLRYVNYSSRILGLNHYRGLFPAVKYAEAFKKLK